MVLSEVILTSTQLIGFGFTFIMIVISVITLIIKINRSNQEKLDLKLDKSIYETHEKAQQKDLLAIDLQLQDIYKDIETKDKQLTEIRIFMGRIDENLKHINSKLDKL